MSIVFTFFKHPKLPISIKIPVTLLQSVYICMTAIIPTSTLCNPASCMVAIKFSRAAAQLMQIDRVLRLINEKTMNQPRLRDLADQFISNVMCQ